MENVAKAPYADTPIHLSMLSTTSKRHKTYYCIECRHPFLQRDFDTIYRINNNNEPSTAHYNAAGAIMTRCAVCNQKYTATITIRVDGIYSDKVHAILQSIYLVADSFKSERYIRCMDCGGTFCTLHDRVSSIVDNYVPFEFMAPDRISVIESRCKDNKCRQRWALMV